MKVLCAKTGNGEKGIEPSELVRLLRMYMRSNGANDAIALTMCGWPPPCWQCVLDIGHEGPCRDFRGMLFDADEPQAFAR